MSGLAVEFARGLVHELQTLEYATTTSTELMRLAAESDILDSSERRNSGSIRGVAVAL